MRVQTTEVIFKERLNYMEFSAHNKYMHQMVDKRIKKILNNCKV